MIGDRKCYAFIFARGGSKGIPRKNIKILNGKPLIAHAIDSAKQSRYIDHILISTDDEEIATVGEKWGGEVPFLRPAELADDASPEILSWKHMIQTLEKRGEFDPANDIFVSIPCTSPFRTGEDIDACIDSFSSTDADACITVTEARRHPSFNMVKPTNEGLYELMLKDAPIARRQDAPPAYDITTVCYVLNPSFIMRTDSYMKGKIAAIIVPEERALDIDTELDFEFAEFLMEKRHGN